MHTRHSEPFETFVAAARHRPALWRLGLGLVLTLAVNLGVSAGVFFVLARAMGPDTGLSAETLGTSPGVMVVLLFSFAGLALGTWAAARLLHGRGWHSLIGDWARARRHFLLGAALIAALYGLGLWLGGGQLELDRNLPLWVWLLWLPLALVGLMVQTGAEELALRGYLQQQLAARFASAWVWMVLPSVLFGLLHYEPATMGANTWLVVGLTGLFGLVAADLTARSGTLGLAWGLHFANNFAALLIVAPQGPLSGLALFTVPFGADDTGPMRSLLLADLAGLALIWGLCRLALRRRG
ncbi:MAG: CPBP family intramembrane glutamic endopeptidase [Alkalilacustris sp.]